MLARQKEDERQADFQRRLAGIHSEGPSREERAQRRHKSGQAASSSDSAADFEADQSQNQYNIPSSSRLSTQHTQHDTDFPAATQHSQHRQQRQHTDHDQQATQHPSRQRSQRHPAQHSQHNAQHSQHNAQHGTQHAAQQEAQHDAQHDQAESSLPRLRPRSSRRRTFQESFAWSPLDAPVPQRRRTDLESKPKKNMAGLLAAAKGLPHSYGRNRRGRWVMADVPEEDIGQVCLLLPFSAHHCLHVMHVTSLEMTESMTMLMPHSLPLLQEGMHDTVLGPDTYLSLRKNTQVMHMISLCLFQHLLWYAHSFMSQDVKPKPGPRPRRQAVVSPAAAPSSPAASWDSGPAQHAQHTKARRSSAASRANFPDVPDRYTLQVGSRGSRQTGCLH